MTSLYEISYYGIEQHITLTLPAWRCLFTVRNYMTLFNTFVLMRTVGLVVRLSLGMANWSRVRDAYTTLYYQLFFIAIIVLYFLLSFFTQWLIYQFSFHIDILI